MYEGQKDCFPTHQTLDSLYMVRVTYVKCKFGADHSPDTIQYNVY